MTSRYFPASMSCLRKRTSFSPAWPMTSSLSGKPSSHRAIIDLGAELALSSASVRCRTFVTVAVVTHLGTQTAVPRSSVYARLAAVHGL